MSRPWGGPNHCGGFRAAEPGADAAVLTIEPGPAFVARLREALAAAPAATRYLIPPSPLWGGSGPAGPREPRFSAMRAFEASGTGSSVTVYAVAVSDTCKEVIDGIVRRTVPRDSLVTIVGPWVFTREALTEGLARIEGREREISGLVAFCQAARLKVRVVIDG